MFGIWFEKELLFTKEDVEGKAFVEYSGAFLSTFHVRVERFTALKTVTTLENSKWTEVALTRSLWVDSALNATLNIWDGLGSPQMYAGVSLISETLAPNKHKCKQKLCAVIDLIYIK